MPKERPSIPDEDQVHAFLILICRNPIEECDMISSTSRPGAPNTNDKEIQDLYQMASEGDARAAFNLYLVSLDRPDYISESDGMQWLTVAAENGYEDACDEFIYRALECD